MYLYQGENVSNPAIKATNLTNILYNNVGVRMRKKS